MAQELDVMRAVERAPLRTLRYRDLRELSSNAWRVLDDLVEQSALTRLAEGIYTAPPDGRDGRQWKPDLETAGLAIATARHGDRQAVLMGIGAARHWGAFPRAVGVTLIAVHSAGHRPITTPSGTVRFVARDLDRLDAVLDQTELGPALIATPSQTMFDLLMRPTQSGDPAASKEAAQSLIPQVDAADLHAVISRAGRASQEVRDMARRVGERR